uniref:Rad21_Rec8_N domain-containing protein n=1 Tax=Panagrellus redivivus TaxID=6233 RepID=A0A7E4UUB2_PANRE
MFYTQFLLSKKGPLAKIWLAAHWEKKLSKAQVYETSVSDAVEEIMKPKVKMALRTTGHLLLGVVRIYSRRAKYLLEDCNSAILKINVSFTTGGDRRGGADNEDGVMAQVMIDFDDAPTDFNDFDAPTTPVPINQSRIDDITIHEENTPAPAGEIDDGFGDGLNDDFGEAGSNIDEIDSISIQDARRELSVMSSRNHTDASNSNLIEPMTDDQFERASQLDDMFSNANGDNNMAFDNQDYDVAPMDDMDFNDVAASFQLQPLQADANTEKPKTTRKRRRLIVDDVTSMTNEVMRANIHDFDDIVQPLDLAPPTKKLMQIKENGIMEKLFSAPGCNSIVDPVIIRLYQSHLEPKARIVEDEHSIEHVRQELGLAEDLEDYNVPDFEPMDDYDFEGNVTPPPMDQMDPIEEVDENVEPDMPEIAPPSPIKETERRTRKARHAATAAAEESGDEEEDEHRCSKRTHAVATAINTRLNTHESISLNDLLTKSSTRKTAAQKFYALLELAKWQAVEVAQAEPFGEITITTGPQMETVLAS